MVHSPPPVESDVYKEGMSESVSIQTLEYIHFSDIDKDSIASR